MDDFERRNSPNRRVISLNSVALGADYVKVVEDTAYFLQRKCRPKNLVFSDISFMAILAGGMAVALHYFTDIGKPVFQHNRVDLAEFMYESIIFCSACTMSSVRKFTFAISSPDEFLVCHCVKIFRSVIF